jgi:cobalt/nickel transport protein
LRKNTTIAALIIFGALAFSVQAWAHFAMIIPSQDVVGKNDKREIALMLQFTHPFEGGPQMEMAKPQRFGVVVGDSVTNLLDTLKEKKVDNKSTWETTFKIAKPGDYVFFLDPQPYWEPAEDKFIVHVTKVIVDALGAEEGWDKPIAELAGIPVEIVPRARPYSMYTGNIFSGQVFRDGKPVPDAEVEVEWWGKGATKAATDSHVTQVIKADANGVFHYSMPKAGWWGFSAIMEGDKPIKHESKDRKVELAAVMWVYAHPME